MARKSLVPQISSNIIEYVQTNRMQQGQHLPLQLLADTFRVSRAPILSALQKLEGDGIVRAEPNRGYFLAVDAENIALETANDDAAGDEAIYFRMAEDRLSGKLEERVSENELMRFYDVPRTRLLKVLHRIADEGWIERLPGNGWAFRQALTSRQSYEDGYAFRAVIEQQAMLLPTFEPDVEGLKRAREVQTALRDGGFETWSRADIFKANNEFHEMLVACSRNEFFLDSIKRINRLRRLIEYHITIDRSRLPKQTAEHLHILDLVEDGRRNEAAAFLFTHIMGASRIKTPKV
ncbi:MULTISPECIES: GntR family transcriptional regulator [Rhizobium/Agrobacterium group]|uniref:GntR family transcriptional regulator n=1 Tax=Rhizobium/Agrobacterium group TaxID=227290 RepID=UPI000FD7362B|nr:MULTISPECIES: GntR family transcriptional regulator [Rhizobium/Agrobacterium group]MBB4401798.1 DNA-binding GntR family transcriptional regulator [Agrobacterium radiobacter]MBB5587596.1 DNA-binding GntR family transcriptional regulator [Agrobacterium radiobacter]RVT81017.1 GntR family transcriptional regulator [Agrobacterium sp. CNPSo 2736]TGE90286.1 transcriptional regulator [Rhizobium sp. SEMIA 4032]